VTEGTIPEIHQWSDEAVAASFRAEIHARMQAHNAAFRAREAIELAQVLRANPERKGTPGFEVRDSGAWEIYQASEIQIDRNAVTIVLPTSWAIDIDFVYLFDHTTMAWSRPSIGSTLVDGEARVTIKILLVATWTDEMDAKWRGEGHDRKRVLVELYEQDVRTLEALVVTQCAPNDAAKELRSRLLLSLEALP
jgi:hypothetical protein